MIDLTIFLIISIADFDNLLLNLGIPLLVTDNTYFISYIVANLFAYLVIVLFIVVVYKTYNRLMRRTGSLLG